MLPLSRRSIGLAFAVLLTSACGGGAANDPSEGDVFGAGGAYGTGGTSLATGGTAIGTGGSSSAGGVASSGATNSGGASAAGGAASGGSFGAGCTNVRPTGTEWDAAMCEDWASATSECSAAWMIDNHYCDESCGRCTTGGSGGAGSGGGGSGGAASGGSSSGGAGSSGSGGFGGGSKVKIFLAFGQSNMWGVPPTASQDSTVNPKVEVMALTNCAGQSADNWYPASPPLHGCIGKGGTNPGLGPSDYFAKAVAQAYPNDTILIVPNAIPGVSIDTFAKGSNAYNSIISRAKKAQQRGTIVGILFHQGESDSGSGTWVSRVKAVVDGIRSDLSIGNVPFVAGELPYTGCCGTGHNPKIAQLPGAITNAHVVSASGLTILADGLHFDTASQREFGKRYAQVMLPLLGQ